MSCLPCKEEIDNGMGIFAANLYANVMEKGAATTIDVEAPRFYAEALGAFSGVGRRLLDTGRLTKDQTDSLMAQIDKACYRSDLFIQWARSRTGNEHDAAWTQKIFEWVKDDQTFYTALSAESKG